MPAFALNAKDRGNKIIWRFSDGRPGHDSQSKGLSTALSALLDSECYEIKLPLPARDYLGLLFKKDSFATNLPRPDLLIGAGHATHLPILAARQLYGGLALVLMKPSLPTSLFDFCLIPEHDRHKAGDNNVITTAGPLNSLHPAPRPTDNCGLILVGGASKHFNWDDTLVLQQITQILQTVDLDWTITDSPRTPPAMRRHLQELQRERLRYLAYGEKSSPPAAELMLQADTIWVSEDSMSMIYEALSSGAAVGILQLAAHKDGRLANVARALSEQDKLTLFNDWHAPRPLAPPAAPLQEAARCAQILVKQLGWKPRRLN